jgi:hypothetical protein
MNSARAAAARNTSIATEHDGIAHDSVTKRGTKVKSLKVDILRDFFAFMPKQLFKSDISAYSII